MYTVSQHRMQDLITHTACCYWVNDARKRAKTDYATH